MAWLGTFDLVPDFQRLQEILAVVDREVFELNHNVRQILLGIGSACCQEKNTTRRTSGIKATWLRQLRLIVI